MPQFIDYGVSSSATRALTYCGRGEKCERMKQENREYVTIEPYVSFDGEILMCHVIFPGTCISSHMAPKTAVEKINNLPVSTTNSGYHDGRTCLASYKMFAKAVKKNKVRKPIVVLTDGHSSRYDADVMQFYRKEDIPQFMGLPDTIELTQLLDQVFANLHACYSNEKDQVFDGEKVNREGFMQILASIWDVWTTKESLIKAARRVGITSSGININDMQKDKFAREKAVTQLTPTKSSDNVEVESPLNVRHGSKEYWHQKCENYNAKCNELIKTPISPDDIPGLLTVQKKKRPNSSKPVRVTQVCRSMEVKNVLEKVLLVQDKKKEKEEKKKKRGDKKEQRLEAFCRCKDSCVCIKQSGKCHVFGLRYCSQCKSVLKSDCTKMACKMAG